MSDEGQDLEEHLVQKYGPSAAKSVHDPDSSLKRMGRSMGIEFNMSRKMVNTKRAHALMEYIKTTTNGNDVANMFMEDMYRAYFEDARDINDPTVLLDILSSGGDRYSMLDVDDIKTFLNDGNDAKLDDIARIDRHNKSTYGVSGVPFFMVHPSTDEDNVDSRPVAFSGAYPIDVIAEQLQIAAGKDN